MIRLGFLGLGWIGRHRMAAMLASGATAVAVADPAPDAVAAALALAPDAVVVDSLEAMLAFAPDGIVIATPNALHAAQSIRALDAGVAVFCQKPLGRTAAETRVVVDVARAADRLLGVDLSYRFTAGMVAIRDLVRRGDLGRIFAVDLVFHNAYGPGKSWFYDPAQAGGGCVVDLGVHLVDLALWVLGPAPVGGVSATLLHKGLPRRPGEVEDFAIAEFKIGGATVRLTCSWTLHAGRDAEIAAVFYGIGGGAALRNVGGSFYDFTAERFVGTAAEVLSAGADEWGGRAAVDWVTRLAAANGFDPAAEDLVGVADVLDRLYAA